jgi:hypothetical protein
VAVAKETAAQVPADKAGPAGDADVHESGMCWGQDLTEEKDKLYASLGRDTLYS